MKLLFVKHDLMDPASAASIAMSGEACETSASANTMYTTPTNSNLGARAALEEATTAGGGAWQHTTGTSKKMTQEGHDIAAAGAQTQFPSVLTNEMSANSLANIDLDARAADDAACGTGDPIDGQREDREKSRTARGGAQQLTTGTRQPPEAMSSGDPDTTTHAYKSVQHRTPDRARYRAGQGLTKVKSRTSKSGTPAASAAQPEIGHDGAWVRREQSLCPWDPPAHFPKAPTNRYSGYQQPLPSRAGSQSAHAMLLRRKSPTAVPH